MIKFFRKIRQKLLSQGKFSRYLIYAIGEIILVVIGILIALRINNWNTENKRHELERTLLTQIQQELSDLQKGDLEGDLIFLELTTRSHERIGQYIAEDRPYADSMCFDFHWLKMDDYIYPISPAYDMIKAQGMNIIRNDSIRTLIQNLFEEWFPRISKGSSFYPDVEEYYEAYFQDHFKPNKDMDIKYIEVLGEDTVRFPYTRTTDGAERMYTVGYVPLDFEALKADPKFAMLLYRARQFAYYKLSRYRACHEFIDEIDALITKELE